MPSAVASLAVRDGGSEGLLPESAPKLPAQPAPAAEFNDFDWHTDDTVLLKEQLTIAAYFIGDCALVIRQRAGLHHDDDTFRICGRS